MADERPYKRKRVSERIQNQQQQQQRQQHAHAIAIANDQNIKADYDNLDEIEQQQLQQQQFIRSCPDEDYEEYEEEYLDFPQGTAAAITSATMFNHHRPIQPAPAPAHAPAHVHAHAPPSSHHAQSPESQASPYARRVLRITVPNRIIGGVTLPNAILKIQAELDRELRHQRDNPPALPRSMIADLPPKPEARPWSEFPQDVTDERRREIEEENNAIAAENQRVERERNNAAAKKSRQKRLEALENTRVILNAKAAECDWWRMRAMTLGATAEEWLRLSPAVKMGMEMDIARRVAVIDQHHEEERKQEEAYKRAERARVKQARIESHSSSMSPDPL